MTSAKIGLILMSSLITSQRVVSDPPSQPSRMTRCTAFNARERTAVHTCEQRPFSPLHIHCVFMIIVDSENKLLLISEYYERERRRGDYKQHNNQGRASSDGFHRQIRKGHHKYQRNSETCEHSKQSGKQ